MRIGVERGHRLERATPMNLFDLVAIVVVALGVLFGWRSGFVVQVLALHRLRRRESPSSSSWRRMPPASSATSTRGCERSSQSALAATIVLLAQGIGSAVGGSIAPAPPAAACWAASTRASAQRSASPVACSWSGSSAACSACCPSADLGAEARQSLVLRALDSRLPSPVVLAAELGRLIQAAGLPDILVGAPPPIDAPTDGPSAPGGRTIAAAARGSTVRVEGVACGHFVTGSGFAVTADHFVTNAHVVAGAERCGSRSTARSTVTTPASLTSTRSSTLH